MAFRRLIMAGAAALLGLVAGAPAQAQNTQVGLLQCDVSGGVGLIITSQKELICNFRNSRGEYEVYTGVIRKFGLDIGATAGGTMAWSVLAPSGRVSRGALAGSLCRRDGRGDRRRRRRRERPRRRLGPLDRAAAALGHRAGRPQPRGRRRRPDPRRRAAADGSAAARPPPRLRRAQVVSCGRANARPFCISARFAEGLPSRRDDRQSIPDRALARRRRGERRNDHGKRQTRCGSSVHRHRRALSRAARPRFSKRSSSEPGRSSAPGTSANGNTVGDQSAEARAHAHERRAERRDRPNSSARRYTFIDCPGSVEFTARDAQPSLPACDAAVVVCEADERKIPALEVVLRELEEADIPRFLFLNKIDTRAAPRARDAGAAAAAPRARRCCCARSRSGRTASRSASSTSRSSAPSSTASTRRARSSTIPDGELPREKRGALLDAGAPRRLRRRADGGAARRDRAAARPRLRRSRARSCATAMSCRC